MKILMLVFNQTGRGTWFRAYEFGRSLVRFGHEVTLVSTSPSNRFRATTREQDGVQLVEAPDLLAGPLRSGWDPYDTLVRLRLVDQVEQDIVHAFESRPVVILPALHACRRGTPLVMDWADWFGRGGSVEERPSWLVRSLLRGPETFFEEQYRQRADATTVICSALRERAISLGVRAETIELIPNGFDTPGWVRHTRQQARQELNIPESAVLVGYVGSLFPGDARLMAEAFNHLTGRLPGARLVHAGASRYSTRSWLAEPSSLLETGPIPQSELSLHLSACDVCWLPFRDTPANRGRFPMKLSNYLAAGKAIVSTRVGEPAAIIAANHIGRVTGETPGDLAQGVLDVLGDKKGLTRMEHASLELGSRPQESWEARSRLVEKRYREIAHKKTG